MSQMEDDSSWRETISLSLRLQIRSILLEVLKRVKPDSNLECLEQTVLTLENEVFQTANSRGQYYYLNAKKVFELFGVAEAVAAADGLQELFQRLRIEENK